MRSTTGAVKDLPSQVSTFSIAAAKREDEGTYICWGTNVIGDGVKGELGIKVNVKPVMLNSGWASVETIKENEVRGRMRGSVSNFARLGSLVRDGVLCGFRCVMTV